MARYKHKRSSTASKVPVAADFEAGEILVNTADGRAFVQKGAGVATIPNQGDNDTRYVRHDTDSQGLNSTQQGNALTNLGVSAFARTILDDTTGAGVWATLGATGSLAGAGYVTLPNGLIMQWGSVSTFNEIGSANIVFPVAFPNTQAAFVTSIMSAWGGSNQLRSVYANWTTNLTGREIFARTQTGSGGVGPLTSTAAVVRWIAIGW